MKRKVSYGIVAALVLMYGGVSYAATCGSCGNEAKCKDPQAVQQFRDKTSQLRKSLNEKEIELHEEYGMDSIDTNRTAVLETEIRDMKKEIRSTGENLGFAPCCIS
ncbi:hypothetical protein KI811_11435 [Geobacter hydrogenophilus]|uniref:Secreted protein n=1 Tax=Geobacter hydrogenophilus TaxID=40983 RepID=A0A9W6G310_9BACT|nr:hypothetical protein [Geobacter hydrogenophilus]MBT0894421.1 hypothetical protein [Geobacter hydrogenophilus]GLI39423.1 hypothetical protein GHYDROH2_29240 [Geobacter hydrogenophilus]